ncbi:hypothetical protein [Streptomyces sp. NPDC048282]|uniref:hypothetical protein n=1 Tax=Streptomyces sp. NPDC048282 TaxID=3365528 RepID=UPI003724840D
MDEIFMLIKGTALLWSDDQEMEPAEGGIVCLPLLLLIGLGEIGPAHDGVRSVRSAVEAGGPLGGEVSRSGPV